MSSQRGRRKAGPRQDIPVDIPYDLPAPSTSRTPLPRSASQATSQSRSAAASRSHSPMGSSSFSQRSLSTYPDFSTSPLEIESLAGISMNPDHYNTLGPDMLLDPTFGDNNFNNGSTSIGYQDFSSPLAPATRTRKKELFVDPMPGEGPTFAQSSSSQVNVLHLASDQVPFPDSGLPAEGSRTAAKRKRSRTSSIESSSNAKMEPLHISTEMAAFMDVEFKQENDLETPSTPSQDRKGKGKPTDRKGKGKQREVIPEDSPIVIPDSPIEALKPLATTTTLPAKPLSEPLSAYTCPICFSAPTNATLTPCGHICCGVCLFTAVKTVMQRAQNVGAPDGNEARCPVCRALIPDWDGKGGGVIGLKIRAIFSL